MGAEFQLGAQVAVTISLWLSASLSIDGGAAAPVNVTPRLLLSVKDEEDARELVNGLAHAGVTCAKYYGATQKRESGRKDKSRLVAILPRPPSNQASVGNRHNLSRPSRRTLLRLQKTVRQREERGEEERQGGVGGVVDEECGGGRGRMSAVTEPKSKKEDRKATAGVSIIGRTQSGTQTWREIAAYIRGELRGFLVPASCSEKPHREPRAGLPTSRQYRRPRLHTHTNPAKICRSKWPNSITRDSKLHELGSAQSHRSASAWILQSVGPQWVENGGAWEHGASLLDKPEQVEGAGKHSELAV